MGIDARILAEVSKPLDEKEILDLSWRISEAFGSYNFLIDRRWKIRAIDLGKDYDREELDAPDDKQILRVNLAGRFYGDCYERGDICLYISIAEWLELNLPEGSIVHYGGDECVLPFDSSQRKAIFEHFSKVGHTPYRRGFAGELSRYCEFCEHSMIQTGTGGGFASFYCSGCGYEEVTHDNGVTWKEDK